jgi:hypothetical protein
MCFPNPGLNALRLLILFDIQAAARGGFRNPGEGLLRLMRLPATGPDTVRMASAVRGITD